MKKSVLLVTLFLSNLIWSQTTAEGPLFGATAPTIVPNSPEASNLGRYGSIPLSSPTGQMNFSVPIHTINIGGNNWPISLNYNYAGLILEGKPSLSGLGWYLSGGGSITREVRGLPDEHEKGYYGVNGHVNRQIIADFMSGGADAISLYDLREGFYKGQLDSEVDKYNVNVAGLNFSFKIALDGEAFYLSKHGYKVEINRNQHDDHLIDSFTVIDTNGTRYIFSNIETSQPLINEETSLNPATSWNITRVEFINGQNISFFYQDDFYTDYSFTALGAVTVSDVDVPFSEGSEFVGPNYQENMQESQINRKLLRKIECPKGSIEMLFTTVGPSQNPRLLYDKVLLKDRSGGLVSTYDFSYSGPRDMLKEITLNGIFYYGFQYYDENDVPDFIASSADRPFAQDYWKFFNGQNNQYALNIPGSEYIANKEPSLRHTRFGALRLISYPTKGATEITYEQNQQKTDLIADSEYYGNLPPTANITVNFESDYDNPNAPEEKEVSRTITLDYLTVATIRHSARGGRFGSHVLMDITKIDEGPCENGYIDISTPSNLLNYYDEASFLRREITQRELPYDAKLPIMCPQLGEEFGPDDEGTDSFNVASSSGGKILIQPGRYRIRIYSDFNRTSRIDASISIQLFGEYALPPPDFANQNVGGIRVSQMKDCPYDQGDCITRTFDYNDSEGFSTATLYTRPLSRQYHSWTTKTDQGEFYRQVYTSLSNPFTVLNPSNGTPVFYRKIRERNGDLGATETEFSFPKERVQFVYPRMPRGVDLDKSLPTSTKVFKKVGNTDIVLRQSENRYQETRAVLDARTLQDMDPRHPWSLKVVKKQHLNIDFTRFSYNLNPTDPDEIRAVKRLYEVVPYREVDNWDRNIQTISEVIENEVTMTTITDYTHHINDAYQLIRSKTIDSHGDVLETENFYPGDIPTPVHDAMVIKNQISSPVLEKSYRNNILISQRQTEFIQLQEPNGAYSGHLGYKSYQVNSAKGSTPLESRLRFTHDNRGRIQEVIQLLGPLNQVNPPSKYYTTYLWGYGNEYPVAKIERASMADVTATGVNLDFLSSFVIADNDLQVLMTNLRNALPSAYISSYIHIPLIGVKSETDPRKYTMHYTYDELHRLQEIRDANNDLISDYKYRFQGQADAQN